LEESAITHQLNCILTHHLVGIIIGNTYHFYLMNISILLVYNISVAVIL